MKILNKLPFVLSCLTGLLSIFFPYASLSLIEQSESADLVNTLFGLGPIPGYNLQIGIGIAIVTFVTILITFMSNKKSVILWTNFITSIMALIALVLFFIAIKNAFYDSGIIEKLIAKNTFSVKVEPGVYIAFTAMILNLIFCFIISKSHHVEQVLPMKKNERLYPIDWAGQIEKLADLKERGIITTKEYLNEKNEILKNREKYY